MSKKRLEEIKKRLALLHSAVDVDDEYKNYIFKDLKVEWLIEQAERVQELERKIEHYRKVLEEIRDIGICGRIISTGEIIRSKEANLAEEALEELK